MGVILFTTLAATVYRLFHLQSDEEHSFIILYLQSVYQSIDKGSENIEIPRDACGRIV